MAQSDVARLTERVSALVEQGLGLLAASAAALSDQAVGARFEPSTVGVTLGAILVLALLSAVGAMRRVVRIDPMAATSRTGAGGLA